jgi:hypothetical protein
MPSCVAKDPQSGDSKNDCTGHDVWPVQRLRSLIGTGEAFVPELPVGNYCAGERESALVRSPDRSIPEVSFMRMAPTITSKKQVPSTAAGASE